MIDTLIFTLCNNDVGIRQYCDDNYPGPILGTRVYPINLPQEPKFPALTFVRISGFNRELHHAGAAQFAEARYQFDCFAADPQVAKKLAIAVAVLFHGKGHAGGGDKIWRGRVVNEIDFFDRDLGYRVSLDIIFAYVNTGGE